MDESIQKSLAVQPLEAWRKVLLDAADLLERDGWCQGEVWSGRRHCALGAIGRIAIPRSDVAGFVAIKRLARAVSPRVTGAENAVADWNDAAGKCAAEVIHTMRMVAES